MNKKLRWLIIPFFIGTFGSSVAQGNLCGGWPMKYVTDPVMISIVGDNSDKPQLYRVLYRTGYELKGNIVESFIEYDVVEFGYGASEESLKKLQISFNGVKRNFQMKDRISWNYLLTARECRWAHEGTVFFYNSVEKQPTWKERAFILTSQ